MSDTKKTILYTKWQLANSTGAPELWEELALEKDYAHWDNDKIVVDDEEATLAFVKDYFTNPDSPYVQFLGHCQLGTQIGTTLFTHGGIDNNSFILPGTLTELVDAQTLTTIFNGNMPNKNEKGKFIARNVTELLKAENAWYDALWQLYRKANQLDEQSRLLLNKGLTELVNMGLPAARNGGETIIHGAFGSNLNEETVRKLLESGVHELYHGHIPAARPRICKNVYTIDGKEIVIHRIGADTCNYRKNEAAIAINLQKKNDLTHIAIDQIDESEEPKHISTTVPVKNQDSTLSEKGLHSLIGTPINLSDTNKGWNIVNYLENEEQFELFKQNGPPNFDPESKLISPAELIKLQLNEQVKTQGELDKKSKAIKELEDALDKTLKLYVQEVETTAKLKTENEILVSLMNNKSEHKYFALIQNKLLPMTKEYQAYIKSKDLTSMDEIKKARTISKIELMDKLIHDLNDIESSPRPSERVNKFFITLNSGAETLKTHRDSLSRFITDVVTAARLFITVILPSLIHLTPFTQCMNVSNNSMSFWKSRGCQLQEDLEEARNSMSLN